MRSALAVLSLVSLAACDLEDVLGLPPIDDSGRSVTDGPVDETPHFGEVRLFASDPLRQRFDFLRERYGAVIQDGEIKNAGSHVDFGGYFAQELTFGVQGGEVASVIDLGSDAAVAAALGLVDALPGDGYAAIAFNDEAHTFEGGLGDEVFDSELVGCDHVAVIQDHVVLARIADEHEPTFELIVKLFVVDDNGTTVLLDWEVLAHHDG